MAAAGAIVAALWVASGWARLKAEISAVDLDIDQGVVGAIVSPRPRPYGGPFTDPHKLHLEDAAREARFDRGVVVDQLNQYRDVAVRRHFRIWRWDLWVWSFAQAHGKFAGSERTDATLFVFPLWPIPLLLWTPAALLLRSGILARRRAVSGKCKSCGYDLAGLAADAPCPECGKQKTSHG